MSKKKSANQVYVNSFYEGTMTAGFYDEFKKRMKDLHDYDVIPDAVCPRCKKKIRWAFWWSGGRPLTTTELVERCYWSVNLQHEKIKSWHRTNVSRVAV